MKTIIRFILNTLVILYFSLPPLYAFTPGNNSLTPVTDSKHIRDIRVTFDKISGLAPPIYLSFEFRGGGGGQIMSGPLRKVFCINPSYNASPYKSARNIYTAKPHTDSPNIRLKNNLPVQTFKNGSLRSLFPRNAVSSESHTSVWQIINACETVLYFKFNPQSDIPCIRLFDPG